MPEPSIRRCSERRFNREVYINMCRTLLKNTYAAIVALFVALLALPTTMQAQGTATIILEAHDVWADGSGYQMLLDADHTAYGTTFQATGGNLTEDCNVPSNLYDAFEYKIPAAADPSCTSTNVLVNGELSITIPAGTYDYCIAGPQANEKIWIVGNGGPNQSRADDFVFEAGKTYRFLIKKFGSGDGVELTVTGGGTLNTDSYITLTVTNGAAIKLDFKAASAGTPIRIVSGSNTQDITVGTDWYDGNSPSTFTVTAAASTMTIYGDLMDFACSKNGANLTALDPSHNTQLTELFCWENNLSSLDVSKNTQLTGLYCSYNTLTSLDVSKNTQLTRLYCFSNTLSSLDVSKNTQLKALICHGNNFSTAALDDIFCALPDRTGKGNGVIQPVYSDTSSNHAIVLATNKANAIAKNWKVQYYKNDADIPATTGSYVCSGGGTTTYDLEIAGVKVTSDNCSDLSVIPDVSGTVKYDPVAKVLTLDGATIQINTTNAIVSGIDDLTVKVIGTNNLTTDGNATMTFRNPITITGGGTLNAKSNTDCGIYVKETNLTIDGCTVNAKGVYGIAGKDGSSETLTIKNSTVTAEGASNGCSIADFASLTLDGCAITEPAGAAFDASLHAVALGGTKVTSKVVISRDLNVNSYITLTVTNGAAIKLDFKAASAGTPVRIVSGSNTRNITVGTGWYDGNSPSNFTVTAAASTMTVYGDIMSFDCSGNGANLTALDVSNNTQLIELYCYGNNFTTAALDVIYCALPDRMSSDDAMIFPLNESSSVDEQNMVATTNAANATAKNWRVLKYKTDGNHTDIATTGSYDCSTAVAEASAEPALTLYPNPVADVLYLSATARTIRVYDIYGTEVAHAADTDRVAVAHLPAGVYTVRADGTVAKMVKR